MSTMAPIDGIRQPNKKFRPCLSYSRLVVFATVINLCSPRIIRAPTQNTANSSWAFKSPCDTWHTIQRHPPTFWRSSAAPWSVPMDWSNFRNRESRFHSRAANPFQLIRYWYGINRKNLRQIHLLFPVYIRLEVLLLLVFPIRSRILLILFTIRLTCCPQLH